MEIKLNKKAQKYFNEVMASLEDDKGKPVTKSQAINHCLTLLALFEEDAECDLLHFMTQIDPDHFPSAGKWCDEQSNY